MREVIKTGRTVEDATELALAELGVSAEEAGIEVLELPQRRLFKSIPAKVRAYVEDEEVLRRLRPRKKSLCQRSRRKQPSRRTPPRPGPLPRSRSKHSPLQGLLRSPSTWSRTLRPAKRWSI